MSTNRRYYDKLVRDRIPEVISAQGKGCEVRVLGQDEYLRKLNEKLQEELDEYQASGEIAELADLVEVVSAILRLKGISDADFEELRATKRAERGGFERRLLLISVME